MLFHCNGKHRLQTEYYNGAVLTGQNTPRGKQFLTARFYLTVRASTGGQTDRVIPVYPPLTLLGGGGGGIINLGILVEILAYDSRPLLPLFIDSVVCGIGSERLPS